MGGKAKNQPVPQLSPGMSTPALGNSSGFTPPTDYSGLVPNGYANYQGGLASAPNYSNVPQVGMAAPPSVSNAQQLASGLRSF